MRTTIRLNDKLLIQIKKYAHDTNRSFTAIVEEALRLLLERKKEKVRHQPSNHFTIVKGNGLHPGIDLNDSRGLLDVMESSK